MQGLFAVVTVAALGIRLWTIDWAWSSFDPVYADAQRVLTAIPPGATVATAFQSIMTSPEHRLNQLAPDYSRIWIGIVPTDRGLMVTEDFAD